MIAAGVVSRWGGYLGEGGGRSSWDIREGKAEAEGFNGGISQGLTRHGMEGRSSRDQGAQQQWGQQQQWRPSGASEPRQSMTKDNSSNRNGSQTPNASADKPSTAALLGSMTAAEAAARALAAVKAARAGAAEGRKLLMEQHRAFLDRLSRRKLAVLQESLEEVLPEVQQQLKQGGYDFFLLPHGARLKRLSEVRVMNAKGGSRTCQ